jgi:hypothetical protein
MAKSEFTGTDKVISAMALLPKRITDRAKRLIDLNAVKLQRYIKTEKMTGRTTESRLAVRSGRLRASVLPIQAEIKGETIEGGISIGTIYGRVHIGPAGQTTTMKPKTGKYLTIPLPAARAGKGGQGPGKGSAKGGPWGETFVAKSRAGNLIIFGKLKITKGPRAGELRQNIVPLFLLKKQVTIKARIHPEDLISWIGPKMKEDFIAEGLKVT